jgi:hypothetical protein
MKHVIVCPYVPELLEKLENVEVVIHTDTFENVNEIIQTVSRYRFKLIALRIDSKLNLSAIPFDEFWCNIPIALYVNEFGDYYDFFKKLSLLKKLNIRVFLSSGYADNYNFLKILSSLGISSGIFFDTKVFWENLSDLMIYSYYSKAQHEPIEPFNFLLKNYTYEALTDFGSVYFNNPMKFLHINTEEGVSYSSSECIKGEYVVKGIDKIDSIIDSPEYELKRYEWQNYFLENHNCTFCPGWRICINKFNDANEYDPACKEFFTDLIEQCDSLTNQKQPKIKVWQL